MDLPGKLGVTSIKKTLLCSKSNYSPSNEHPPLELFLSKLHKEVFREGFSSVEIKIL